LSWIRGRGRWPVVIDGRSVSAAACVHCIALHCPHWCFTAGRPVNHIRPLGLSVTSPAAGNMTRPHLAGARDCVCVCVCVLVASSDLIWSKLAVRSNCNGLVTRKYTHVGHCINWAAVSQRLVAYCIAVHILICLPAHRPQTGSQG